MLSVSQAAEQLGVTPSRVRALIKHGRLPASKNGREWVLREEDVAARLFSNPQAGRPRVAQQKQSELGRAKGNQEARAAYDLCRELFRTLPSSTMISQARSHEEASFYMAVADFFLQQKQADLVHRGVF